MLLQRLLLCSILLAAIAARTHPENYEVAIDWDAFHSLIDDTHSIHSILSILHSLGPKYKHGVFSKDSKALKQVHSEDPPLATSLLELAKRQSNLDTTPAAASPTPSAATSPTSPAAASSTPSAATSTTSSAAASSTPSAATSTTSPAATSSTPSAATSPTSSAATSTTPSAAASSTSPAATSPTPSAATSTTPSAAASTTSPAAAPGTEQSTSQTNTGTGPSVTEPSGSPTAVSAPSKVLSLSISSSVSVAPMALAASSAAPVPNPIVSFPTSTYTGQALLTAACAIPLYTAVPLSNGSYLAAPVVGCAEQNPQCCPSVSQDSKAPAVLTASIIPFSEANPAIVSALKADPLILCPADYRSTARSCCPVGFSLYNQQIIGQTPCYSILPQPLSIPKAVSKQISSLSRAIAATATAPNPTVSVHVIIDEIFALPLPLKNGIEHVTQPEGGLSLGAKIGIGVGGGLGAIIAITLIVWLAFYIRKHHRNGHVGSTSNGSDVAARTSTAMSSTVTGPISNPTWSPMQGYTSYTNEEHIPGPGGGRPWSPSSQQQQQQYVRMPPPRTEFQPIQTAYGGQQIGGQMRYSELSGAEYVAPVEVEGREETRWYGQHQHPTYGQVGAGYSQSGGAVYTAYAPPPDHVRAP